MNATVVAASRQDATVEIDGLRIHMLGWRPTNESYGKFANRKPRAYASGPATTPAFDQPAYSTKGENPALDAAWRVYNREEVRLQKALVVRALDALIRGGLIQVLGHATDYPMRFSRKAGCSCGCSPAHILDFRLLVGVDGSTFETKDIFVSTIEA